MNLLYFSFNSFRNQLIVLMASSTTFSSTYPELSTPPHQQSDSSPIDSSQFAEADRAISELIQAMANQTNVLETSDSAAHLCRQPKTALVFRGKPLAMELYKPKRKRVARSPDQLPKKSNSRRGRNVSAQRGTKADTSGPASRQLPPCQPKRRRWIRL